MLVATLNAGYKVMKPFFDHREEVPVNDMIAMGGLLRRMLSCRRNIIAMALLIALSMQCGCAVTTQPPAAETRPGSVLFTLIKERGAPESFTVYSVGQDGWQKEGKSRSKLFSGTATCQIEMRTGVHTFIVEPPDNAPAVKVTDVGVAPGLVTEVSLYFQPKPRAQNIFNRRQILQKSFAVTGRPVPESSLPRRDWKAPFAWLSKQFFDLVH